MKNKYLNNRDLLKEIHLSKNTFCSFLDPDEDHHYDVIIGNISEITDEVIAAAKKTRADRMQRDAYDESIDDGVKKYKMADFKIDPDTIPVKDLVFRVMTFDHIPLNGKRKKNPKSKSDHHDKVNFPPFQHFRLDDDSKPFCVGKSHWLGGLHNGHFELTQGKMTPNLARMFLKLCERFATRGNWRGYTYNDEMRGQALLQLTQIGLQFDESKSNNPFSYYTAVCGNSFTRVLNLEKRNQNIRDDILEMNNQTPSYTRQFEWSYKPNKPVVAAAPVEAVVEEDTDEAEETKE